MCLPLVRATPCAVAYWPACWSTSQPRQGGGDLLSYSQGGHCGDTGIVLVEMADPLAGSSAGVVVGMALA